MVVARGLGVAFLLALGSLALGAPTAGACHDTYDGCLPCPSSKTTVCSAFEHPAGSVNGVTVYAGVVIGTESVEESVAGGGRREGYVLFRFERASGGSPVSIDIQLEGAVAFDEDRGNLTYGGSDEQEARFGFTTDGAHHTIRFRVTGSAQGQADESVDGTLAVTAEEEEATGPGDWFRRYWMLAVLIFLVGIVVGLLVARLRAAPAHPGPGPLA